MPPSFGPAVIRSLGLLEEGPMCLAIPGKVAETYRQDDLLMGKVDFGGVAKRVCLEHVPEVRVGDYVLVHVGFALSTIDEDEARRVFELLDGMNQLDELRVPSPYIHGEGTVAFRRRGNVCPPMMLLVLSCWKIHI